MRLGLERKLIIKRKEVQNKMGTLREESLAYSAPMTLNIADLTSVPIDDLQVLEAEKNDSDGKPFKYKYTLIDEKEYRIPATVLEEIQTIVKLKPEVKVVKVNKTGSGLATRYKVEVIS